MAKKVAKKLDVQPTQEYTYEDARQALDRVEEKLDRIEQAIRDGRTKSMPAKASKVKISPVPMPTDIEIDVNDKLNTQPKNSVWHNYAQNHRMFRRDAFRSVMQSKMFWILLVTLPIIMTFIEFILTGWGFMHNMVLPAGLSKVATDLLNWWLLMPLLLMSLLVFPTFIAVCRENNQLKRYTMKGMSRKQIYWSYIRFTTLFLLIFIFIWLGPWIAILNFANEKIWDGAGNFPNPWWIIVGNSSYDSLKTVNEVNPLNIVISVNIMNYADLDSIKDVPELIKEKAGSAESLKEFTTWFLSASTNGKEGFTLEDIYSWHESVKSDVEAFVNQMELENINPSEWDYTEIPSIQSFLDTMNDYGFEIRDVNNAVDILFRSDISRIGETNEYRLSSSIGVMTLTYFEGVDDIPFVVLTLLAILGINSIGFNKAMKVGSSRALMGWGIGLWIFATIVQGTSTLLFKDIYAFNSIDSAWNYVVMILLFALKWMFLLSPVTIIMVGISFTTGLVQTPELFVVPEIFNTILANPDAPSGLTNFATTIVGMEYDPLVDPILTKNLWLAISGICSVYWILKTWIFKSRIVSYEAAR